MSVNNLSERGSLPTFLVVVLAVVFIGISVVAGYFLGGYFKWNNKTSGGDAVLGTPQDIVISVTSTGNADSGTLIPGNSGAQAVVENNVLKLEGLSFDLTPYQILKDDGPTELPLQYASLPLAIANSIQWVKPVIISSLGFFNVEHSTTTRVKVEDSDYYNSYGVTSYYVGGYFEHDGKNGLIIFADPVCLDCMGVEINPSSMFVLYNNEVVLLNRYIEKTLLGVYPTNEDPTGFIVRSSIKVDKNFSIAYLNFPKRLNIQPGITLDHVSTGAAGLDVSPGDSDKKVATVDIFGDVYLDSAGRNFRLFGKDGRERVYEYVPDAFSGDKLDTVIFNDGKRIEGYRHQSTGGCGRSRLGIVYPDQINAATDLKEVGKTVSGLKVFGLIDQEHKILKDFYKSVFFPVEGQNVSYDDFIKERPMVFFIDTLGRVISLELNKFVPAAECGKPVIYLYPEQDTKVKVNLQVEKFSYTEPEYGSGWEVLAKPDGEITNLSDGKQYPYLFWEGIGVGEQPEANSGFVITQGEVNTFLNEKLLQLGLQGREVSDFIEFWQPRMTKAPYYFVTFYGTSVMNQIAPLKVQPKPDTVIRILMDYRPLQSPVEVKEQRLSHLPRTGFTVIEWGGVLGRE